MVLRNKINGWAHTPVIDPPQSPHRCPSSRVRLEEICVLLSRPQKDTSEAAALAGSTISGLKMLFQSVMNRNPQAARNFLVESLLPKVRLPPIGMNEIFSCCCRVGKLCYFGYFSSKRSVRRFSTRPTTTRVQPRVTQKLNL